MRNLNPTKINKRTDEWLTPPEIIKSLGIFDLDPCSSENRPWDTAKEHFTFLDNGLFQPWTGRVWLNPPYSALEVWLNKMCLHLNGTALVFGRTDTKAFHNFVFPVANSILFIKGRIRFYDINGNKAKFNCGTPSVLIAYTEFDSDKLANSKIKGFHFSLIPELFLISFDKDSRTWKIILQDVMNEFPESASLSQIYEKVIEIAPKRVRMNKNFKAKIRQTLQFYFTNIEKGIWKC